MSISAAIKAYEMRDAIYSACSAQMATGGKLSGLSSITKSTQFAVGKVPALGVMLRGFKAEPYAQRVQKVTVNLELQLAMNSVPTATRAANLADAMESLRPLIDDGNGKGLVSVLNDPSIFGAGSGSESRFGSAQFFEDVNEGEGQSIWAYFVADYIVTTYATF